MANLLKARYMGAPGKNGEWILFDAENLTYEGKPEHYVVRYWRLSPCNSARWYVVLDPTREGIPTFWNGRYKVATISVYFDQALDN